MLWDDQGALSQYDSESWSIWSELAEVITLWEETYRDYWGLDGRPKPPHADEAKWVLYKSQNELASKILTVARALHIGAAAPNDSGATPVTDEQLKWFRKVLRAETESPIIKDRIGFALARDVVTQVSGATNRAVRLLGVVQGKRLSARAFAFIRRATQLYVWGFEPECVVMCRAGLESALLERLGDVIDPDQGEPELASLIRMAGEHGILTGYEMVPTQSGWRARHGSPLWRAQRLRWSGNYAAHDAPELRQEHHDIVNAFEAIRELSLILRELFPPPKFE